MGSARAPMRIARNVVPKIRHMPMYTSHARREITGLGCSIMSEGSPASG